VSVPASGVEEALAIWEATDGVALPALAAFNFPSEAALQEEAARCLARLPAVSIALGGGADVSQWRKVLSAGHAGPLHLNQPFTTAAYAKGRFNDSWVNGVIEPTAIPGRVKVTGIAADQLEIDLRDAARILLDGQLDALKLHPTDVSGDFRATVAAATEAADVGIMGFEPAGGLGLENTPRLVERLIQIPRLRILPHVFGAVIDKSTGKVDIGRVRALVADLRLAVG